MTARAATAEVLELTGQSFLDLSRRAENNKTDLSPEVQKLVAAYHRFRFHHSHNDSIVMPHHIFNATRNSPLKVYGAGTHMMPWNYTVWTEVNPTTNRTTMVGHFLDQRGNTPPKNAKRQSSCVSLGASDQDCPEGYDSTPGDPTDWYTGVDVYGSFNDEDTWVTAMGSDNENDQNILNLAEGLGEQIDNGNYWESCVCGQGNGNWIFTGSIQATWGGVSSHYTNIQFLG
jgi:hypothetical protein